MMGVIALSVLVLLGVIGILTTVGGFVPIVVWIALAAAGWLVK